MPLAGIECAQSAMNLIVNNDAPTIEIRYVMGLKKLRDFLVEREKPRWRATHGGSSGWSGGVQKGKPSAFSGTSHGRRAGGAKRQAQ
jgi:hypothetical protein